jgi:2-keto-4-pentenoate hydratase/2-oxohepta-3-ene-1,7-dioic acid hydratase in catechol pathway
LRWATLHLPNSLDDRIGLVVEERIFCLEPGLALLNLLGDDGERLARAAERARREPREVVEVAAARLRPPIPRPPSVRDFYAFEQHVKTARQGRGQEMDPDWYALPVFYFSNPHATYGPAYDVPIPPGCQALDYELEVAAVVGRSGGNLKPEEAEQHLVGFTIMNDWSARDLQRREMRQMLGPAKGKDFATSLGPFLVTRDELAPFRKSTSYELAMTATVNGKPYSRASLAELYWSFEEMLAYASRGTRIEAGDVIGSGTCGTGCILELSIVHGAAAYPWLKSGDEVVLTVEHLGTLANRVVEGPPLWSLRPKDQTASQA